MTEQARSTRIILPYPQIEPVQEAAPATPSLWNVRYTQIDYNFAALKDVIEGLSDTLAANFVTKDSNTGAADLPSGTTSQRPAPEEGKLRFNKDTKRWEGGNGQSWASLGGATGGGTDAVFYLNDQNVNTNYTIPTGQNAMSAGSITIKQGVSVNIPSGSAWSIV